MSLAEIFTSIYARKVWNDDFSGPGSRDETTPAYRALVEQVIRRLGIRSVLDWGCGYWTFSRLIDWGAARYVGLDLVDEVIEHNRRTAPPEHQFWVMGEKAMDVAGFDLVIIKDVLQHLSYARGQALLGCAQRAKWLLVTNDWAEDNMDCRDGEHRPLNLRTPPFQLDVQDWRDLPFGAGSKRSYLIRGAPKDCRSNPAPSHPAPKCAANEDTPPTPINADCRTSGKG